MESKHYVLYHLFKWSVVAPMLHVYFRGRIYGADRVPLQGPLVVACNHASYFDPPLVSCGVRRPVAYMAKEELFRIPVLKQGIELYGAYPVKRAAADRSAMRAAIARLQAGWAVGIFLQGTRTPDARIPDPKLGAATIAAKTQSPILPLSLWGTQNILADGLPFPRPVPIAVRIGPLLDPPPSTRRQDLQATTAKCTEIIESLHALGR